MTQRLAVADFHVHDGSSSPGTTLRIVRLARSLRKIGVNTEVFSPFISRSTQRRVGLWRNSLYPSIRKLLSRRLGVDLILHDFILDRVINRLTNQFEGSLSNWNPNIIQGEQEIAALACLKLAERVSVPMVASLHNIWAEELVASGIISRDSREFKVAHSMVGRIVHGCDLLVVVSEEMADYVISHFGASRKKIVVMPPAGVILNLDENYESSKDTVVYAGSSAQREHVDLLIRSMPYVQKRYAKVTLHMTKRGDMITHTTRLARDLDVRPNYFWFEREKDFFTFLSTRTLAALPSSNDIPRSLGPPLKMLDYMSAGLPIVANRVGGWSENIRNHGVGVLTEDSPDSFANGIEYLLDAPDESRKLGAKGRRLVKESLNWDKLAESLSSRYHKL